MKYLSDHDCGLTTVFPVPATQEDCKRFRRVFEDGELNATPKLVGRSGRRLPWGLPSSCLRYGGQGQVGVVSAHLGPEHPGASFASLCVPIRGSLRFLRAGVGEVYAVKGG